MSNNKQSSVDWFSKESLNLKVKLENKKISIGEYAVTYFDLLRQAKAMHKEEMIEFGNDLLAQNDTTYIAMPNLSEQYYNQLFGGNK